MPSVNSFSVYVLRRCQRHLAGFESSCQSVCHLTCLETAVCRSLIAAHFMQARHAMLLTDQGHIVFQGSTVEQNGLFVRGVQPTKFEGGIKLKPPTPQQIRKSRAVHL